MLALTNDAHPGAHALVEVTHGDSVLTWGDLVEDSVRFGHLVWALVLEVATSFTLSLNVGDPDVVFGLVETTVHGTSSFKCIIHFLGHSLKERWVGGELGKLFIADTFLIVARVVFPVVESISGSLADFGHDVFRECRSSFSHSLNFQRYL